MAWFAIEGGPEAEPLFIEGVDSGTRWNGFANPRVGRAEALRFVALLVESDRACGWNDSTMAEAPEGILYTMANEDESYESSFAPDEDGLYSVGWGYTWDGPYESEAEARKAYGEPFDGQS